MKRRRLWEGPKFNLREGKTRAQPGVFILGQKKHNEVGKNTRVQRSGGLPPIRQKNRWC